MSKYTVELDVPIPKPGRRHRKLYPWHELKAIGASFFIPVDDAAQGRKIQRTAHAQAARMKVRFTVAMRWEKGQFGVRVWKVSDTRNPRPKLSLPQKPPVEQPAS